MGRCRRHPHHVVVGVCAYCLNENLTTLLKRKVEVFEDSSSTHINFSSQYKSPIAFASLKPSTSCSDTLPDTPLSPTRRMHKPYFAIDSTFSRPSSNQFSHPLSPLPQHKSQNNPTSSNLSPLNQVFFGNQDFIKGEIPRKSRSPFWSFLHKRKDGYFDGCGIAHWHHDYGLENVRSDPIYDDDDVQARGFHLPAAALMHVNCEKCRLDRHTLSEMSSSLMRDVQPGINSYRKKNGHFSLPHAARSPERAYRQRLSPLKQDYFHNPSSHACTVEQSPLRHEAHHDNQEFSRGQHGIDYSLQAHYLHGSQRNIDDRKNQFGGSSSWISSLFPQRIRRSKSISGLPDMGIMSELPLRHACRASPDAEPTRARPLVAFAEKAGVPKCMPIKVSRSRNVHKGNNYQSPNKQMHIAQGQSKSPSIESSSFHGFFGKGSSDAAACATYMNHADSPMHFSSSDMYAYSSPQSVKPISGLFARKRSEAVSVDCGKDSRVSPIAMLDMKRQSSKSPLSSFSDEYGSLHHCNQVRPLRQRADGRTGPGCSPNFEPLHDDSSTIPSDDKFRKGPMSAMKEHMQSPMLAPLKTKCAKVQNEHYGNQGMYSHSTMSWSKALKKTLAPMLGIGRGKKQRQAGIAHHNPNHGVQEHCTDDEMLHDHDAHIQNAWHEDHDYVIDFDHNHQNHSLYKHIADGSIEAPGGLYVRESHVLPGLDSRGAPQQYSFLSRDYSAFSFYFSPRQGYGSAEKASFSSYKPVQAGTGDFCLAKPC